jgi:hypothetical protein
MWAPHARILEDAMNLSYVDEPWRRIKTALAFGLQLWQFMGEQPL